MGTARWDTATSDPVANIDTALRTPLVRPNVMVIGEEAYDVSRMFIYYNARWRNNEQDKDAGSVIG